MKLKKILQSLKNMTSNELNDLLATTLQSIDLMSIGEYLLKVDTLEEDISIEDAIYIVLSACQYIETDTTMESPITDELYDSLHEKYRQLTGKSIVGTPTEITNSAKPLKPHTYPELRGSLDKVHFINEDDIPDRDSRKSLEGWFMGIIRKYTNITNTPCPNILMYHDLKFDGLSGVFECTGNRIDTVLTRKDVDANLGVDVTHIFQDMTVHELFKDAIPEELTNSSALSYGIKTEMLVIAKSFEEMKQNLTKSRMPKNRRSAASMIVNTSRDEFDPEWSKYLTVVPFQISCFTNPSDNIKEALSNKWLSVGEINGRPQYLRFKKGNLLQTSNSFSLVSELVAKEILDTTKNEAETYGIPIDGVVFTITNKDIAETIGRDHNINKFQIAYKFPAGVEKTKVTSVEFMVGPVAGTITPLAKVEPVIIMGNTITNVSLSNYDKLDRLNLHIGDEVMVKYDIIPTLYKTSDCVESGNPKITPPMECPICHEPLTISDLTVRCTNTMCSSRVAGKIYNYVKKLGLQGIGLATIEDLISIGCLNTIPDLYKIHFYKDKIISMPGYGEKSYDNLVKGINSKLIVYPHELLGALGIPDIGRTIMKKICKVIPVEGLLYDDPTTITKMIDIDGIGEKTAIKICAGMESNREIIKELMRYLEIKPYDSNIESNLKVLFTKIRDPKFAAHLEYNYGAEIMSGYSSKVTLLIVPDENATSSKITAAKKDGKLIMTIAEAKEKYNYTE